MIKAKGALLGAMTAGAAVLTSFGAPVASAQDMGDVLVRCQNIDTAAKARIELCSQLVDSRSADAELRAEALLNRGDAHEDAGDDEAALKDYSAAIALNPDYPAPYGYRGALHERLDRFEEAVKDFTVVLRDRPDDRDVLHARARSYLVLGKAAESAKDYDALVKLDGKDIEALLGRGAAREEIGDKAGATADYRAVLGLEAENADAKQGLDRLGSG
ncbi:MAG: tetratricopeptide repeat protein [Hyphomicrobiaceae bacterium]